MKKMGQICNEQWETQAVTVMQLYKHYTITWWAEEMMRKENLPNKERMFVMKVMRWAREEVRGPFQFHFELFHIIRTK